MQIESHNRKEKMIQLSEKLLMVKKDRQHGSQWYAVNKVIEMMRETIKKTSREESKELLCLPRWKTICFFSFLLWLSICIITIPHI